MKAKDGQTKGFEKLSGESQENLTYMAILNKFRFPSFLRTKFCCTWEYFSSSVNALALGNFLKKYFGSTSNLS